MAEQQAEFKILITGDATDIQDSAKQAGDALNNVAQSGKDAMSHVPETWGQGEKAIKNVQHAVEKTELKHKDLHAAVRGLREEFPLLAHIAHLAINPIGLAVAGVGAAFAIWRERVKSLQEVFGGLELPDVSSSMIGHVNAAAEAWQKYGEAVRQSAEAYQSADSAAERYLQKLSKEAELQKTLLASQKALEEAKLEESKSNLPAGEYDLRRAEIEDRYAKAGIAADEQRRKSELSARATEAANLAEDAERKRREAAGIKLAGADDDAKTLEKYKANADAAQADLRKRMDRLGEISELESMGTYDPRRLYYDQRFQQTYGFGVSYEQARDMENQGISTDRNVITGYNDRLRQNAAREEARRRREQLLDQAAKEEAQAANIRSSLPEDIAGFNREASVNRQAATNQSLARAHEAASSIDKGLKGALEEMTKTVEAGHGLTAEMINRLGELRRNYDDAMRRIESLERTRKANPPGM